MRRSATLPLLGLGLAAVLAACADGVPSAPEASIGPTRAISVADYPSCDPSGIRSTMATLFQTSDLKKVAMPLFNSAEQYRQAGETELARTEYFKLLDNLLTKYTGDRLKLPSQYESMQDGVTYVMASVLQCAEDDPIYDLDEYVQAIGSKPTAHPNFALCLVLDYTKSKSCVPPGFGAAVVLDGGFLEKEALILIRPVGSSYNPYFTGDLGTTWSDVWEMRVEPKSAQVYAPPAEAPDGAPAGHAAVCLIDKTTAFKHPHSLVSLGYRPHLGANASATDLDPSSEASTLLNCPKYDDNWENRTPAPPTIGEASFQDRWPTRELLRGLRSGGHQLARLVVPQPLYAFDGGIGGKISSFESYVSAVGTPGTYVRNDPISGLGDGPLDPVRVRVRTSVPFQASRTPWGDVISSTNCSWSVADTRVALTTTAGSPYVTIVAPPQTLTTTLTVDCDDSAVLEDFPPLMVSLVIHR